MKKDPKGMGAEDDIGLALFSLHSRSQQLCLNWLVLFSGSVLLYGNKRSTRSTANAAAVLMLGRSSRRH